MSGRPSIYCDGFTVACENESVYLPEQRIANEKNRNLLIIKTYFGELAHDYT